MIPEEVELISKIADRAVKLAAKHGSLYVKRDALMDLMYANECCPLNLSALLAADEANFAHDVFGINRHLNRRTLKLEDCFVPCYAVSNEVV